MNIQDYPAQEPFTKIGALYHDKVIDLAGDIVGHDISYGDDPYQSMTIYPADDPDGNVMCFMHGGGWTNGYKEWMSFMAPALNSIRCTFVSLGYRLAPTHLYPAGFEDCCDAIKQVHHRVTEFGGNPERIFVGGHSAGGHYAALMGLLQNWQSERSLPKNIIKGVLPVSGTFEFGENSGLSMRPRFLGPEETGNDAIASPINHIQADAPPFFISWGEKDFPHLVRQADSFTDALRSKDISVHTEQLTDCDHLGASYACGEVDGKWVTAAADFMGTVP
ncbi:MAG: arylformamidase [Parasphingorhabdus sp.]|jgi:arylformamidase